MPKSLRDIRELGADAEAYRDEIFRRWTGLLSYPYIGRNHSAMDTVAPLAIAVLDIAP